MKPTRIIEEPELMPGTRFAPRGLLLFKCDDGKLHTLDSLAEVTGKRRGSIYEQLRRHGWKCKNILKDARRGKKCGQH